MNLATKRGCAKFAFTLAEVLMAVLVVGLMTIFLYGGFSTGFAWVQLSREDLRATQILMQKMEGIRLCTWSSLSNCPISFATTYDPLGSTNNTEGTIYSGTLTTNTPSSIPNGAGYKRNMCLVTGTIYWTNYYGSRTLVRSRQMQTLVARYGVQNYIWGAGP